jgi:hypothetical protein
VEYSQFDRRPAYAAERERGPDRRSGLRREADRSERMREMAAFVFAFCGGLAVLYVFFVVLGTIEVRDAAIATGVAAALAVVWLFGYWRRLKTGAAMVQRPDRERRGF